jgi:uncharacterized protein (DUF2249 family)
VIINVNTKIGTIIKHQPDALEAIVGISTAFEKLRNPLLRKIMAGRTSIAMASKVGGCTVDTFFEALKPLGFETDTNTLPDAAVKKQWPGFLLSLKKDELITLDVRPVIATGQDPLNNILQKIKSLQPGQVLKIINSFEPVPLIQLLEKKGFEVYADVINKQLVETYFYKVTTSVQIDSTIELPSSKSWNKTLQKFTGNIKYIDVRQLEMPLPMITIMEALQTLAPDELLFVYHKRIPVFLLPELTDRSFEYLIKETANAGVELLIFKS